MWGTTVKYNIALCAAGMAGKKGEPLIQF